MYIEHDLVFPVSPLLPHQATCLSLDPEQVAYGEMGRVFNPLSQATLSLTAIGSKPTDQRAGLRGFLTEHLGRLEEYTGPRQGPGGQQREGLATSLLRLAHALLLQGFFEPDLGRRTQRGAWVVMDEGGGGGMSARRSLGELTAGMLTSFFGGQRSREEEEEEEERQRASEWGPPTMVGQAVAASAAAAAAAAAAGADVHPRSPIGGGRGGGLLSRLVSPRGRGQERAGGAALASPVAHTLSYSFLEATLILTLEAAGRATVARAKAANGGEASSLQDLQVSGSGAFNAVFDEPGPIALKAEVVRLLRTLADIRSIKNAKALLSSFRLHEHHHRQSAASAPHDGRSSVSLAGRESTSGGSGGSKALNQVRFGRTQEAVLERGFDDRSVDGEVFLNAVVGATAHRDRRLLVKAYDLLYRHSIQRVAFAALLEELDVSRRPSLAITMRTQRLALELFEKHAPGFQQQAKASCDLLSYVLHLLTRLCYRNWDEAALPLLSPTATVNGMPGGRGSSTRGGGAAGYGPPLGPTAARCFRVVELEAMFASSGEDGEAAAGGGGGSSSPDPFGGGKPPFVNAETLGLEDACSHPIRAQQEELQRAARRVAAFLVRVLQTSSAQEGGVSGEQQQQPLADSLGNAGGRSALLKKASTLGVSSSCGSTGSSFHTADASAAAATAAAAASSLASFTAEQRRVVGDGFAFLYHSCRGQPELLQSTALPLLRVLRAHAPEFPHAMALLAAVARTAVWATGLGLQDVDMLLNGCIGTGPGAGGAGGQLKPEVQTEALGLVRAILEFEAPSMQQEQGSYEGDRYHRQYTVSSGLAPTVVADDECLKLKAAVLDAVWRRLLDGGDAGQGVERGAAVQFSLSAMGLSDTTPTSSSRPMSNSSKAKPQQPSSSSSPVSWRPPPNRNAAKGSLASRDWPFKHEGLALVCACLDMAAQLEQAQAEQQTIVDEELDAEGPSPVNLQSPVPVVSRGGSYGAADPASTLKLDAVQGVRERIAVLYPPEDCLAVAMDATIPLPVRTLLLRLVKLQAFAAAGASPTALGALADDASSNSSTRPSSTHGGGRPLRPAAATAAASPPPPPLEEVKARLAAAAAASTKTFGLMQTFATGCQHDVDAFRRSIRLGMVTFKEMEGMAAFPYLAKAVPAFVLAFLRRQGCGPDVQEALQLSLASAKRKLEREQSRSRLWKATEGVLPHKVAQALLVDSSGEEVMAWIVDAFVHTGLSTARAADSGTDPSSADAGGAGGAGGFLASLGRVASASSTASFALHHGGKLPLGRNLFQQATAQQQAQQQQEPEPPSLQVKVLGQVLGLIERLAGLILHVPALQAQWAAAPDPVAQNFLVLLAFGAMAEKVYHVRGSPQQLAALAMGRAPSGVSLQGGGAAGGGPAAVRAFYRKSTLDGSTASRGTCCDCVFSWLSHTFGSTSLLHLMIRHIITTAESLPGQTASSFLGATLSSLPGVSLPGVGSGNSGNTATAPTTASTATDSRFIVYLTQALEARRASARAAAEEEELLRRQLPAVLEEARSYVLNAYEPQEVDDG